MDERCQTCGARSGSVHSHWCSVMSTQVETIDSLRAELAVERKRVSSYRTLVSSLESQISRHRANASEAAGAIRTLDSERAANAVLTAELSEYKQDAERYRWRPIETAPKDGSSVLLLVEDSDYPLEDERATATIGAYGTEGGAEFDQTWNFAGWDWCQDCYVRGNGTPTHWMPLPPVEANAARKGEGE
jgi:hypothetical protein